MLFVYFLGLSIAATAARNSFGPGAADVSVHPTDVYAEFSLSGFRDAAASVMNQTVATLQVGARSTALGLKQNSALEAWRNAELILGSDAISLPSPEPARSRNNDIVFSGKSASALNQVLAAARSANVEVLTDVLAIDQPIEIGNSGIHLDLGNTRLVGGPSRGFMLRIEGATNIVLSGGNFSAGDSAILVSRSSNVTVDNTAISGISGAGIVLTDASAARITRNRISGTPLAGIVVHRQTLNTVVDHNAVAGVRGFSNLMAGIVLTDREVDITNDPRALLGPSGFWVVEQPMSQRMHPPHDNLIAWNQISASSASGIYSDGGIRNVIYGNSIAGSSKEGLCLDNGSAANVVASNDIEGNGRRVGEPDTVLALDSVLAGGRLADGTPAAKLPGISLDNTIYDVVFANNIVHNFGGGIKFVRTGYFNAIGLNTLFDNNDGASANFHYFGIELGAAPGDAASTELDFTPSRGDILFSNNIRGNHYSGIFMGAGSDQNTIVYNTIFDATNWALESVARMQNQSLNNLTTLPSRNIGSGLDAALIASGQPVDDAR